MIERFMVHAIRIIRAGTTTGRGDDVVPDWSEPTETAECGWVSQKDTADIRDTGSGDTADWHLSVMPTVDIRPGDRVEWGDYLFAVVGLPNPAWTPDGHHHTECDLKVVNG